MVKLITNFGAFTIDLDAKKAPITAANFLSYVESGFYSNTIFHRVIDGFMIQGGGFTPEMSQEDTLQQLKIVKNKMDPRTYTAFQRNIYNAVGLSALNKLQGKIEAIKEMESEKNILKKQRQKLRMQKIKLKIKKYLNI